MSESDHSDNNNKSTKSFGRNSGNMLSSKTEFHPALAASNIKNHIPIVLEMEKDQYDTWAKLFRIHAHSCRIGPNFSAFMPILVGVVTLEQEFSHTHMEDFPNVSVYYQRLKMLSDKLRYVSSPVNNHRLSNSLPAFNQARSMLTLEEAGMAKMELTDSHAAIHTTESQPSEDTSQCGQRRSGNRSRFCGNQGRGGGRGNYSAPQSGAPNAPSPWSTPPWQQQ
ncbi:hypothetical protein MTR_1g050388 [Medicago truncatula]|uniref:Uncharacterized protein n=1 Tax=Medicago truncatula TaxID=3880 RepID=A0A072VHB1_MEDTR|nr:hypothetical protein MTR_1g050388 [Medicago truncatula]